MTIKNANRLLPFIVMLFLPFLAYRSANADKLSHKSGSLDKKSSMEWVEMVEILPELDRIISLEDSKRSDELKKLTSWLKGRKSRKIYDRDCSPIRVSLDKAGERLVGDADVRVELSKYSKRVSSSGISVGINIVKSGPGFTSYRKDKRGKWVVDGGGGIGYMQIIDEGLAKVKDGLAWYGSIPVAASVDLVERSKIRYLCQNKPEIVCAHYKLRLTLKSLSRNHGIGHGDSLAPVITISESSVCQTKKCPKSNRIELEQTKDKLNQNLKNKRFIVKNSSGAYPALFLSKRVCLKWKRKIKRERGD